MLRLLPGYRHQRPAGTVHLTEAPNPKPPNPKDITMKTVTVPSYEQVSPTNQAIFDQLKKGLGFVPNLYATFAHSDTALATYLALQNAKSPHSARRRVRSSTWW